MFRNTRPKMFYAAVMLMICMNVTGCQTAQQLGSYLPVYDENNRCDGWLCWGAEKKQQPRSRSSRQRRPVAGRPSGDVEQPSYQPRAVTPIAPVARYTPPARSLAPIRSPATNSIYAPSPYQAPVAANQKWQAPVQQPQAAVASKNTKRPNGFPQWAVVPQGLAGGQPTTPTVAAQEQGGDLHPWEADPEWKKDLPSSPIDALKESLEW